MRWLIAVMVACGLFVLWWSGALGYLSDLDWVRAQVESAGLWGPVLFTAAVVLAFPVFMAGPLIWLSGTIWPLPLAIGYSCIAALLAGALFFYLARWLGQEWADKHIPDKVRQYEAKLEQFPTRTIIILRLVLWINPAVDVLIAVTRISAVNYLGSSAAALIPYTALHVVVATLGIGVISDMPGWLLAAAGAVLAVGVAFALHRKRSSAT
jgi:uncharacterized membrane protein YdjX (TVP38/TMEM64 family)